MWNFSHSTFLNNMFGIKKRHNLLKTGLLRGRTDIHCHLLPGVDDGSPDIAHTLSLLDFMGNELGYSKIWLTPHVMAGLHNTADKLKQQFEAMMIHYSGNIEIHLASEYMMDAEFEIRLKTDPLRLGKDYLLVETSYMSGPNNLNDILINVWNSGFHPLIAHPERYMYMEEDDYWSLKDKGYEFQLNLMSLSGYYGGRPKYIAVQLLEDNFYDFVGTDLHHLERYRQMLSGLNLSGKQLDKLENLLENNSHI